MHTVDIVISPQLPFSINTRCVFASWSDGGARSHSIMVPPTSSTQLTLPIFAADVAAAGAFQIGISNSPEGAVCSAFVGRPFTVLNPM